MNTVCCFVTHTLARHATDEFHIKMQAKLSKNAHLLLNVILLYSDTKAQEQLSCASVQVSYHGQYAQQGHT